MRSAGRFCFLAALLILCGTMIAVPLVFGGRHLLAHNYAAIAVGMAAVVWCVGALCRGRVRTRFTIGSAVLALLATIAVLQSQPEVFNLLAGDRLKDFWANSILLAENKSPVFAALEQMQFEFIAVICSLFVFYFLGSNLFTKDSSVALKVVWAVVLSATVSSVVGMVIVFDQIDWFMYLYKGDHDFVSAGYPNRDHFAQLANIGFFSSLGLFIAILYAEKGSEIAKKFGERRVLWLVVSGFCVLTCFLAMVFAFSRAAVMSFLGGISLFAGIMAYARGRKEFATTFMVLFAGLILASFYGLDTALQRLEYALSGLDPSGLSRMEVWKVMLEVIALSPWIGSGWSAARSLTQTFDTSFVSGWIIYDAHNDYIDLFAIFGIPAGIIVLSVGLFMLLQSYWIVLGTRRKRSSTYPIAVALLVAVSVVLAHEFFEFGLKQPGNMFVFAALCIVCRYFVTRLSVPHEELEKHRPDPLLGIGSMVAVAVMLCAGCALQYTGMHRMQTGIESARLVQSGFFARRKTELSAMLVQEGRLETAKRVLDLYPEHDTALETAIDATMRIAGLKRQEYQAQALSRILDREIRAHQIYRPAYAPYLEASLHGITREQRNDLADTYRQAENYARTLASTTPFNASAVSVMADIIENRSYWSGKFESTVDLHRYALNLFPTDVSILARAVKGFAFAAANERNRQKREELVRELVSVAEKFCIQKPWEVRRVIPLVSMVTNRVEDFERIAGGTISGNEALVGWLVKAGMNEKALSVLERMEKDNNARLDDEKPWTMGVFEYLTRERREKPVIDEVIQKTRISIYQAVGDKANEEKYAGRLRAIQLEANAEKLVRIDELMAEGNWVLAEEVSKRLIDDPRAQLRQARIAYAMSRTAKVGQLLRAMQPRIGELGPDDMEKYRELLAKMPEDVLKVPVAKALGGKGEEEEGVETSDTAGESVLENAVVDVVK